jgi:hypothetical protein
VSGAGVIAQAVHCDGQQVEALLNLCTWSSPTSFQCEALTCLLRLAGAVLVEAHDEWPVSDRRYLAEGSMALLNRPQPVEEVAQPALTAS